MNLSSLSSMKFKLPDITRPSPARDWHIAVVAAALLALAGVGIGIYFFLGFETGAIITPAPATVPPVASVSREALRNVISAYEARAVIPEAIPVPQDPSE